jgi:two-component system chemotaxis sensor kinase CheA
MNAFADPDLLSDFLTEAGELLDDVDRKLVDLEHRPADAGLLNDIFRGFHTIKGGAGFLEAAALVEVCHRTESLFDRLRSGKRHLDPEMLDVILAATASVRTMFGEMARGAKPSPAPSSLLAALAAALDGQAPATVAAAAPSPGVRAPDWPALLAALVPASGPAAPNVVASNPVSPNAVAAAPAAPPSAPPAPKAAARETTLRVDVARFDQILNLSGEIGLTKNRLMRLRSDLLAQRAGPDGLKDLDRVVNTLAALVADLQNAVMKARMQPVGRVFQKYMRLTRDLARQLGKDVDLVIEGEDTEVDKTMLEELNDPIVHLVRNAVDHGVDAPQERAAAGKPARAVIRLSAAQVGDTIEIAVADDGRGMDADVLRRKAVEKGLLDAAAAAALDDAAALELIFLPGFSTKQQATNLSGRGVGMDVVRNNVMRLNGRIAIAARRGAGTTIRITLPLTLAILPVLMFRLQRQAYAVPLSIVREIVPVEPALVRHVAGRPGLRVRGDVLPLVDLAGVLQRPRDEGRIGIVVQLGVQPMVLAVDSFVGQDEVVIKALDGFKPRGVAGATLASDGAVVLVLDVGELLADLVPAEPA